MRILAIDPGLVTGIGYIDTPGPATTWELPGGFGAVVDLLEGYGPEVDLLVVEDFIIDDATHMKTRQPDAPRAVGAALAWAHRHGVNTLLLRAADHKPRSGVKKLRREGPNQILQLGWATKTKDRHTEDAGSLLLEGIRRTDPALHRALLAPLLPHVGTAA